MKNQKKYVLYLLFRCSLNISSKDSRFLSASSTTYNAAKLEILYVL